MNDLHDYMPVDVDVDVDSDTLDLADCECGLPATDPVHSTPRSIAGNFSIACRIALRFLEDPTPDNVQIARAALDGARSAHGRARLLWEEEVSLDDLRGAGL